MSNIQLELTLEGRRVRAGEEGVFFRDVLRMYDKRSTALKTDTPFPGTGVTIEACEALETLVGR